MTRKAEMTKAQMQAELERLKAENKRLQKELYAVKIAKAILEKMHVETLQSAITRRERKEAKAIEAELTRKADKIADEALARARREMDSPETVAK